MSVVTVQSLSLTTAALALAAGFLSFASPCVLPLVPVYLSYVSGVSVDRLTGERDRVLGVALAFVAGFTVVFMALGAAAGGIGSVLLGHRGALTIVAGVFLIVSGLVMAGALRLPGLHLAATPHAGGLARAFVTGAAVSIGWTPCVGYVLGGILALAGSRQSAAAGALLLLLYSIGLGLPFVLMALAFGWATRRLSGLRRHYRAVQLVAGGLLAAFGVLLLIGGSDQLNRWLPHVSFFGL
ncbi:MAG TPA: cytochrome c biogenesis protein CcdA [Thermoleophilia bacterium]|nr:cytochrome c biogenesis protein CcdA [Thermoleophilia bacterium]